MRLSSIGRNIGLVGDNEWERFNVKRDRLAQLRGTFDNIRFKRSDAAYSYLSRHLETDLGDSITLSQLTCRPNVTPELLLQLLPGHIGQFVSVSDIESVNADLLYSGYIKTQKNNLDRLYHHDSLKVPANFNFRAISGLSNEMVERLERSSPQSFGQARRVPGLTPAALSTLLVQLTQMQRVN
jgi:tRNA uridine 5-carboxymethylaminomethyl modification enzyme